MNVLQFRLTHGIAIGTKSGHDAESALLEGTDDVDCNEARDFLRSHGIPQADFDTVWTAIAAKSLSSKSEPQVKLH
jgi:hypothetical protein